MKIIYVLILLFMIPSVSFSAPDKYTNSEGVYLGRVSGNTYNALTIREQSSWLAGAIDGLVAEAAMSNPNELGWQQCLFSYDFEQVRAIFEKELTANPEHWHIPAILLLRSKFEKLCKGK